MSDLYTIELRRWLEWSYLSIYGVSNENIWEQEPLGLCGVGLEQAPF